MWSAKKLNVPVSVPRPGIRENPTAPPLVDSVRVIVGRLAQPEYTSQEGHWETEMGTFRRVVVGLWLLLCLSGVLLTGCHTVHGAGEDIEGAGRSIERATE